MLIGDLLGNAGTGLPGLPADARPARLHLGEVGACQQVLVRQAESRGRCRLVEAGFPSQLFSRGSVALAIKTGKIAQKIASAKLFIGFEV